VVSILGRAGGWERSELLAMRLMFPKGLCTVVVALLPFTSKVAVGITQQTLLGIVALAVIGTTTLTSVGAWAVERRLLKEKKPLVTEPCPEQNFFD
jgi:hypothetical protein